jgi:hypothetical protein
MKVESVTVTMTAEEVQTLLSCVNNSIELNQMQLDDGGFESDSEKEEVASYIADLKKLTAEFTKEVAA